MDNGRKGLNVGDILHLVQIVVLVLAAGVAYEKFQLAADVSGRTADKVERIEHYLSSRDPNYWTITKDQ